MSNETINEQLSAVIKARKDSLVALRGRIADLLTEIPVGTKLSDESGLVCRVARICTGASQWANQEWDVTIKGRGYITAEGTMLATEIDDSLWDGNNMHHHKNEPYFEGTRGGDSHYSEEPGLKFASGKATREMAARLSAALARYMAECESEAAANSATLA